MSQTFPQYSDAMAGVYPDPTQWSNPYSNFNNAALPFPPGYVGTPMNAATGQPIQPPPGVTLNSTPPAPLPAPTAPMQPQGLTDRQAWTIAQQMGGSGVQGSGRGTTSPQGALDVYGQLMAGQRSPAQQQQLAASSPGMLPASQAGSYQNALNLLGNPGTPQMGGAPFTLAQSQAGGGNTGSVLNNFIQNWQQGGIGKTATPGIGGGSSGISFGANNPFFAALGAKR